MTDETPFAMPDRIAIDARGYGWRVWNDQESFWSMIPTNPDNNPIPRPVTWFVPLPTLTAWVEKVRSKFNLRGYHRGQSDYWQGYAACLADVERFAASHSDAGAGKGEV